MSIIRDLLSTTTKANKQIFEKYGFKQIHILSYQCSAQSTADEIKKKWEQTQALAERNDDTIYILLLDEIGLAEHSPFRPLKVLHQLLEIEPAPISFVALSNWPLDAAKMNRVVMHQCYIHNKQDLIDTARAMAKPFYKSAEIEQMESRFSSLSSIYYEIMNAENKLQPRDDFFGARDFYGLIRHFLSKPNAPYIDDETIITYFLRNFGGISYKEDDKCKDQKSFQTILEKIYPSTICKKSMK